MIGWILGGLAAVVAGQALLNDDGNKKNESDNNIMWIQCPFCGGDMTVNQSLDRRHITCGKCQKKFVVDRRIPLNNMLVVQCVSCGRDVEVRTDSDEKATCKHCGKVFGYEKSKNVSCASCGKKMSVPAYKYAEVKCYNCGTVFNSDKGTLYKKTNGEDQNTVSNSHSKNSQELCVIRCPKCSQGLRVPTNKKIEVTCNTCGKKFICDNGRVVNSDDIDAKHKRGITKVNSDNKNAGYYVYAPRIEEYDFKELLISILVGSSNNQYGTSYKNEKEDKFLCLESKKEWTNITALKTAYLIKQCEPFVISAYLEENDVTIFFSSLTKDYVAIIITVKLLAKENYKIIHTFVTAISNEELYKKCERFLEPNRINYEEKWAIILKIVMGKMTSNEELYKQAMRLIDNSLSEFAQEDCKRESAQKKGQLSNDTYDIDCALHEATVNGNINKEKLREIFTEIVRNYNRNPLSSLVYKDLDYGMNMLWRYDVPIWVPFYNESPMTIQIMVQESDGNRLLQSIGVFTEEKFIASEVKTNVKKVGFKSIIELLKKDCFDNYGLVSFNSTQKGMCEWTISKDILLTLCSEGGESHFTIS